MSNVTNQSPRDIAIPWDGIHGTSLGCFMVDRDMKILWHRPFSSEWPALKREIRHCYEIFSKDDPCENCAALASFSSGLPESCEQHFIDDDGRNTYYHIVVSPIKDDKGQIVRFIEVMQDITVRKEAEERHKGISEFNYSIIFNAPVAIFTLNKHGVITSTNPAHMKIAGNPPLDKLMGLDWLHSPNVIKSGLDNHLKRGLSGESFELTDFPFTANITGRKLIMTLRGVPLKNKNNKVEGLLCILEDTTEKSRYLKEIEQLKKYDENIIQSITNGIMVVNKKLSVLTWNNSMEAIFGVNSSDALNLPLRSCLKKMGMAKAIWQIKKGIESGNSYNVEKADILHPTKGFISLNYKIMPLFDENHNQSGVILFFEDITLKEKFEIKYQGLFNEAKDGIVVTEPDGHFLSANPKAFELLQTRWREIKQKKLQDLIYLGDKKRFQSNLSLIRKGREVQPYEVRLAINGKEPLPVEISVSELREQEKTVALQFIMRDIRERIKLEKQLLQASKLSGLGELAAGVAHEINNPLATVSGCAEEVLDLLSEWKIKSDMNSEQLAELKDLVEMMRDQSYRCKEITRNLLDFARVNVPTLLRVDLNNIIQSILSLAGYQAGTEGGRIRLNLAPQLPEIKTDYSQIQQVFLNIFKNALDATEGGGYINITTASADGVVTVTFQDTGVGMSQEELDRMYDPFFTTKPSDRGTGLGLSICYRIVERLGGKIEVSSKKGVGTTFKVIFPIG